MSDTIEYRGKHRVSGDPEVTCLGHRFDGNAEEKRFTVPRHLDGFDLSLFTAELLLCGNGFSDRQPLTVETVGTETVTYRWAVGDEVTASGKPVIFQPVFTGEGVTLHLDEDIFTVASSVPVGEGIETHYPDYIAGLEALQEEVETLRAMGDRLNLLINPNGTVWQRGESIALTCNSEDWVYGEDRWRYRLTGESGTTAVITPGSAGGTLITVTGEGTVTRQQVLDAPVTGTLSQKVDGTVTAAPFTGSVVEQTFTGTALIEWSKLETGTAATPFSPRLSGEELALCRQYYQEVALQFLPCSYYRNNCLYFFRPFSAMRTSPTVTFGNDIALYKLGVLQSYEYDLVEAQSVSADGAAIRVDLPSTPSNTNYTLHSGTMYLDAEVYDD